MILLFYCNLPSSNILSYSSWARRRWLPHWGKKRYRQNCQIPFKTPFSVINSKYLPVLTVHTSHPCTLATPSHSPAPVPCAIARLEYSPQSWDHQESIQSYPYKSAPTHRRTPPQTFHANKLPSLTYIYADEWVADYPAQWHSACAGYHPQENSSGHNSSSVAATPSPALPTGLEVHY